MHIKKNCCQVSRGLRRRLHKGRSRFNWRWLEDQTQIPCKELNDWTGRVGNNGSLCAAPSKTGLSGEHSSHSAFSYRLNWSQRALQVCTRNDDSGDAGKKASMASSRMWRNAENGRSRFVAYRFTWNAVVWSGCIAIGATLKQAFIRRHQSDDFIRGGWMSWETFALDRVPALLCLPLKSVQD